MLLYIEWLYCSIHEKSYFRTTKGLPIYGSLPQGLHPLQQMPKPRNHEAYAPCRRKAFIPRGIRSTPIVTKYTPEKLPTATRPVGLAERLRIPRENLITLETRVRRSGAHARTRAQLYCIFRFVIDSSH